MRKKSVTIKEVARAAGVSAQTVSRVLNDRPDVSEETRDNIRRIISETGYSPNILARSLIQGRSNTIGVVGSGLSYYGPTRILTGIERQANDLGYSLLLGLLRKPEDNLGEDILANLVSRKVDGIIWAVPEIGEGRPALLALAERAGVPVVFINMEPREGISVAAMDNVSGARQVVEHILGQGYQKVGLISGPRIWWESRQREAGWRAALNATGRFSPREIDNLRVCGDWYPASGELGLEKLLAQDPTLDAVFACNDPMALGALQAARKLGRRVPADLAVAGFDDVPEASFYFPPLTTVRQPLAEMGSEAVQMLHRALSHTENDPYPPEQVWLRPELVVRASTIKPA
jgi:DNA-binding LacI/PurR family transcriptional regulator